MSALEEARMALQDAAPLRADCGRLCGAACCQADETGENGMLLYPGEESLYADVSWAKLFWDAHMSAWRLVCGGACPRAERPLGCRFFPIIPYWAGEAVVLSMDVRAWPLCPLMPSGKKGLSRDFLAAAGAAVKHLSAEPCQMEWIKRQTALIQEYEGLKL